MSSADFTSSPAAEPEGIDWGRYALVALGAIGAALLANILFYYVAGLFVSYNPRFPPLATVGGTIVFTAIPAVVAVVIYALLLRFTRNPERIFTSLAVVVLVVSWIPDLTYIPEVPGASAGQTAVLMLMHLIAAAAIVGVLTKLARASFPDNT
jgi:hypothetical protein